MKTKAFLFIVVAGVLWGTSGIFVHALAPLGFSSAQMTFARGLVAFLCMAGYALIFDRSAFRVRPLDLLLYSLIGLALFGTAFCYYTSMQLTSGATSVILMYTAPVYVMLFSILFLGEKLSSSKLVAVILMLAGCCLVSGVLTGFQFHFIGILFGLGSGIAYASYNIVTKISLRRGGNAVSATVYGFLSMSAFAAMFAEPADMAVHIADAPIPSIAWLAGLGVLTSVVPYLIYTMALKDIPAGTASALSIVEPMSATVFSFVLFDEHLGYGSVIGIVLILVSVFLLGHSEGKTQQKSELEKSK
ncbi:MAG: EamA family transporter [Clostridia bacterium]|nr:EamA family transporter [Clostridia bacterium]